MFKVILLMLISLPCFGETIETKVGQRATGYLGMGNMKGVKYVSDAMRAEALPVSYDARKVEGLLPTIKDQGSCGSCWAFGMVKSLEVSEAKFNANIGLNLSEQEMVSCNRDAAGCAGGYMSSARYLVEHGITSETLFPYTARNSGCRQQQVVSIAKEFILLGASNRSPSIEEMKTAILHQGAIFVTVHAGSGWDGSGGRVTGCGRWQTNHIVNLVGWTDDGDWIMANSWGKDWGDNGYALVKFGCANIGQEAGYVVAAP